MIPMYRLQLHGLYGPGCPLSPERPLNSITHSLSGEDDKDIQIFHVSQNKFSMTKG